MDVWPDLKWPNIERYIHWTSLLYTKRVLPTEQENFKDYKSEFEDGPKITGDFGFTIFLVIWKSFQ